MSYEIAPMEASWKKALEEEFEKNYYKDLQEFLAKEKESGKVIYPPDHLIFKAFSLTPFDKVKVVILGQDPYHNPDEAMGLCFSVPKDKRTPPSLMNVYKELQRDLGYPIPAHGDLTQWARQGVLLLNAMLTVEHKKAGSHRKSGWQTFTDAVITKLSKEKSQLVFLLWGNFAKSKSALIDADRHYILEAAHPSPLARNAFNNCQHFSKTNTILRDIGQKEIDWRIN
jgi:uracil-DNA glycosylase